MIPLLEALYCTIIYSEQFVEFVREVTGGYRIHLYDIGVEWRNASASQARGPRFESLREHSSFSLKSPDFVPVASMEAFPGMGQARIESNLFIYLLHAHKEVESLHAALRYGPYIMP